MTETALQRLYNHNSDCLNFQVTDLHGAWNASRRLRIRNHVSFARATLSEQGPHDIQEPVARVNSPLWKAQVWILLDSVCHF